MSIEKMLQEYKSTAELHAFAEAQFKTIQDLNKKIKRIEDEKTELQKLLDGMVPSVKKSEADISPLLANSDQETIAKIQINKLKEISFEREMTLEETRKFEIFTKVLMSINNKPSIEVKSKTLSDEDLVKLISND